ncbi:MAG: hypothetical protein HYS57_03095 [Parcubacteria group bacterium]|nr:hypothetical protein [Parcubacteria group bacterium]
MEHFPRLEPVSEGFAGGAEIWDDNSVFFNNFGATFQLRVYLQCPSRRTAKFGGIRLEMRELFHRHLPDHIRDEFQGNIVPSVHHVCVV